MVVLLEDWGKRGMQTRIGVVLALFKLIVNMTVIGNDYHIGEP
jgi:hypothetical protein